jgi:hypothetical protein
VRPLLPKEEHAGERICVRVVPSTNQLVLGKDKVFTFDHLLPSKIYSGIISCHGIDLAWMDRLPSCSFQLTVSRPPAFFEAVRDE